MEEKFGITNLKYLIALPIEMGNVADKIGSEDIGWKRWMKLVDLLGPAIDLLKVDWSMIKPEYEDLSDVEKEEIKSYLVEKFDIHNDKLEAAIEESFAIILIIESLIKDSVALFKNLN